MTITRVQGNAKAQNNGASITATLSSTPTSGNSLIAIISTDNGASSPITVTGITQTNVAWSKQHSNTAGALNIEIWLGVVSASAGKSVVAALSGSASTIEIINVCEYSGLAATPLDKTAGANANSDTTSTGTTDTTTQANELWIGGVHHRYWAADQTDPTNGFTLLDGSYLDWWSGSQAYLEKIVSSTGTANSGTTVSGQAFSWVGCIATFKAIVAASIASRKLMVNVGL